MQLGEQRSKKDIHLPRQLLTFFAFPCYLVESGPSTVDLSVNTSLSSRVQQISCGRSHSVVLMDNGEGMLCMSDF